MRLMHEKCCAIVGAFLHGPNAMPRCFTHFFTYCLKNRFLLSTSLVWLFCLTGLAHAESPNSSPHVLVSIKPLALIYIALRPTTIKQPEILLPANADLHTFALSPKDIQRLQNAELLLWLNAESEPYIAKLSKRLKGDATWQALTNSHHHPWLNQTELSGLIDKMANALQTTFPDETETIEANREQLLERINNRFQYWRQQLTAYQQTPFLLGHRAFASFSRDIGLQGVQFYRVHNSHGEQHDGMQTLLEIQKHIRTDKIYCAITEPEVKFQDLQQRHPNLKTAYADPMLNNIALSPEGLITFIDQTAAAFTQCLTP